LYEKESEEIVELVEKEIEKIVKEKEKVPPSQIGENGFA
jgi:hypothetical protein